MGKSYAISNARVQSGRRKASYVDNDVEVVFTVLTTVELQAEIPFHSPLNKKSLTIEGLFKKMQWIGNGYWIC